MSHTNSELTVVSALDAYRSIGSNPYIGELPPEAEQWYAVCDEAALTASQQFTAAWLGIELGVQQYYKADRLVIDARHIAKNAARGSSVPHGAQGKADRGMVLLQKADVRLGELNDREDLPLSLSAQVALTYGAVPFFKAIHIRDEHRNSRMRHVEAYRMGQATATEFMGSALAENDLSLNELLFTRLLTAVTINNSLINNYIVLLPAPPRSYEEKPATQGWQSIMWDSRKSRHQPVSVASETSVPRAFALFHGVSESEIDEDAKAILRELRTAMLDVNHKVPAESKLGIATVGWASFISTATKKRQPPVLNLPDLIPFADRPGKPIEVPVLPVDLDPAVIPEINFGKLNEANLFEWYRDQVNGRPFTAQEGLVLDRMLQSFENPIYFENLSLSDQLVVNRIRLEVALAIAEKYSSVAAAQIRRIENSIQKIQETAFANHDIALGYEAAVDQLRLKVLAGSIRSEVLDQTVNEVVADLSDLLVEMDYEKSRIKDKADQKQHIELTRSVLYALLTMYFTGETNLIALPAIKRERGNAKYKGWDVNVWLVGSDSLLDLTRRRKLRVSDEVDRPMRQSDIGIVSSDEIRRTAPVGVIAKNIKIIARGGKDSNRAADLLDKWALKLQPMFVEALRLVS